MSNGLEDKIYVEQAVLGSILLQNSVWDDVSDYLQPDDFASHLHQDIYCVIRDLLSNGKQADIICVSQSLNAKNGDDCFIQLCEILESQFVPQNIKYYAEIVKQKSVDRKMIKIANEMIASVHGQKENRLDYAQHLINGITDETFVGITPISDILKNVLDSLDERQSNKKEITGLATGFSSLDKITHGLQNGDLIILAGRPSMGKTLFGMNIAEHIAIIEKKPVVIFSLEMSKEQLLERSITSIAKVEANQMRSGNLSEKDFQKITSIVPALQSSKLFIDDRSSLTIADIRSKCRRIKREHGLSLVLVDYLTLMSGEGENETLRMGNISRGLKLIARDLNVPIIAISQLNRAVEQRQNKRPCMADLRQSGAIEQDADLILFIYRDEVYDAHSPAKGIAEIIIAKHRNGSLGTIHLEFNSHYCRFDNTNKEYSVNSVPEKKLQRQSYVY